MQLKSFAGRKLFSYLPARNGHKHAKCKMQLTEIYVRQKSSNIAVYLPSFVSLSLSLSLDILAPAASCPKLWQQQIFIKYNKRKKKYCNETRSRRAVECVAVYAAIAVSFFLFFFSLV